MSNVEVAHSLPDVIDTSVSPIERFGELISDPESSYKVEGIERVHKLLIFEYGNPYHTSPPLRESLKTIDDFQLYFKCHDEWRGLSANRIRRMDNPYAQKFFHSFYDFIEKEANGSKEARRELGASVYRKSDTFDWADYKTFNDWEDAFDLHQDWRDRSAREMIDSDDREAKSFYYGYKRWVNSQDLPESEREALLGKLYKRKPPRIKLDKFLPEDVVKNGMPRVTKDLRGRILWTLPSNSDEENRSLGINNIQAMLLNKFPEFISFFGLTEPLQIDDEKKEDAINFIVKQIGSRHLFDLIMDSTPSSGVLRLYGKSFFKALHAAFLPWGIDLREHPDFVKIFVDDESGIHIDTNGEAWASDKKIAEILNVKGADIVAFLGESTRLKGVGENGIVVNLYNVNSIRDRIGYREGKEKNEEEVVELPKLPGGGVDWREAEKDMGLIIRYVESNARKIIDSGLEIDSKIFKNSIFSRLGFAVFNYYPGGLGALQEKMAQKRKQKSVGYWNEKTILAEAKVILEELGDLNQQALLDSGRADFTVAVARKYYGGWPKLRKDLDLKEVKKKNNFWTTEEIEKQAAIFFRDYGDINTSLLRAHNHPLLRAIMHRYSGKLIGLRSKLTDLAIREEMEAVRSTDELLLDLLENEFIELTPPLLSLSESSI